MKMILFCVLAINSPSPPVWQQVDLLGLGVFGGVMGAVVLSLVFNFGFATSRRNSPV
jgi:xanthosine utilization system XapX-like protein